MNCWSCQKEIPNNAEFCPHCEAEVTAAPSAEEQAAAASVLGAMSPDLLNEMRAVVERLAHDIQPWREPD